MFGGRVFACTMALRECLTLPLVLLWGKLTNPQTKDGWLKFLNYAFLEIPFLLLRIQGRYNYGLPMDAMMLKNAAELVELLPEHNPNEYAGSEIPLSSLETYILVFKR